jgi:hypothetical protein
MKTLMLQNPGTRKKSKAFWPWALIQFLPTVIATIWSFRPGQMPHVVAPIFLCVATYAFGFGLAFLFFRFRERDTIGDSLLCSFCSGGIVLTVNAALFYGIFILGCIYKIKWE